MKKNLNDIIMPAARAISLPGRRDFLGSAAVVAATGLFAGGTLEAAGAGPGSDNPAAAKHREQQAYQLRVEAARRERDRPLPDHPNNGDEARYTTKLASFSKGLPHNALGEVQLPAWESLVHALSTGAPEDFERIQVSGSARLVNPQAGLAFEMQGPDSHAIAMRTAPRFDSAEQAAEIAENYWMALTRDISFTDYQNNPLIGDAARDLSRYSDFRAPKAPGGSVTPSQIFRGVTRGDLIGPYISQFFWKETPFGSETIDRRMQTAAPFSDYMTTYSEWLAIQNGATARPQSFDATLRYIRNGRDLGEWVHRDVLFQAYFEALLILFRIGAPIDANNPYAISRSQIGFGTLGDPFIASVLCAVATRALKAVWYQKWFVHRRLRPEVFAGRIHNHVNRNATYPIHGEILNSTVLGELHRRNGSYLLPMVFPEGSPLHPSFGAGHATVAGACVTILKAFFDESFVIPDPVEADSDGLRLHPYSGPPLTVGGELDKLASNVAIGRNIAGVHWRSDATESMRLGEEVAIRFLQEERGCLNERFDGFSLTRFDGSTVIV
jgi:membrane-associated phospholipid phosphatase